jgi:ferritin-like metal-binding protein YciE
MAPKAAQLGHDESDRVTQNLMIAYAVENSGVGMYESPIKTAPLAGDRETEQLARKIQKQERDTAEKVWCQIPIAAERAFTKLTGPEQVRRAG